MSLSSRGAHRQLKAIPVRAGLGLLLWMLLLLQVSCARVRPLSGGEADITPPQFIAATPPDSTTGLSRTPTLTFLFDERLDRSSASTAIRTFPHQSRREISVKGGQITLTFPDSLPADTTFVVVIGKDLKDQNPRNNKRTHELAFLYTTAERFDTGMILGRVSIKGDPAPNGAVQFEPVPPDTTRSRVPRRYPLATADDEGLFRMIGIPAGRPFVLRGFDDRNQNRLADLEELQYVLPETLVLEAGEVRRALEWNLIDPFEKGSVEGVVINRTGVEGRVAVALLQLEGETAEQAQHRERMSQVEPRRAPGVRGSDAIAGLAEAGRGTQVAGDSLFPGFEALPEQERAQSGYESAYALLDSMPFEPSEWSIAYATPRGDYSVRVEPGRHWMVAFVDVQRDSLPGLYANADSTEMLWEPFWTGDTLFVAPGEDLRATTIDLEARPPGR